MTRLEIRTRFRAENPEITDRVITDTVLNDWLLIGNQEVCAETRCIVSNVSETFNTVAETQYYDLEAQIDNFFDIDDLGGGGVYYNDVPLKKVSAAEINYLAPNWRSATSSTPQYYWRRGQYIWFYPKPSEANDVDIDCIYIPNDFDADSEKPFNEIGYLQVYSDALSKYLQWRCKEKVGKLEEAQKCKKDYVDYVAWMKKRVRAYSHNAVYLRDGSRS